MRPARKTVAVNTFHTTFTIKKRHVTPLHHHFYLFFRIFIKNNLRILQKMKFMAVKNSSRLVFTFILSKKCYERRLIRHFSIKWNSLIEPNQNKRVRGKYRHNNIELKKQNNINKGRHFV